jgi:hypothetical protein
MSHQANLDSAAIVCREVAVDHAPILYAARSEPEDVADSGWQFLCGRGSEDMASAQVWAVHEVLAYDQTLTPFVDRPAGTVLERLSPEAEWKVSEEAEEIGR